jgi:hypothetical protein
MNFQRIKINREMSNYMSDRYSFAKPCLKIKKIIEEDYSSFFSKFFDSVYAKWYSGNSDNNINLDNEDYTDTDNCIDFKKDNTVLFRYNHIGDREALTYDIFQYIYSKGSLWRPTGNRGINSGGNIGKFNYSNFISEILLINDTTFAFTFEKVDDGNEIYRSPGIIIFTITNNGNIAMIQPSNVRTAVKIPIHGATMPPVDQYNHLYCATIESVDDIMSYPNIYFGSTLSEKTVLSPIMVIGDDDYCPTCYTVSMAQFTMNYFSDAIIEIEGLPFYYNGFIAVQLDH